MYTVKVNEDQFQFNLNQEMPTEWNCLEYRDGRFHILFNNKSYTAELLETDQELKQFTIKVNQQTYTLQVEDEYDLLIKKLGFSKASSSRINQVKAPMPGLVVDVLVEPGQSVQKGDSLLILGAMKMDNVIKAQGEGTIKRIPIKKGDAVDKSQLLIELE